MRLAFAAPRYRVEVAGTGAEGLERVGARPPDVILLDLHLPDQSRLEVYEGIRRIDARIAVIFVTRGYPDLQPTWEGGARNPPEKLRAPERTSVALLGLGLE